MCDLANTMHSMQTSLQNGGQSCGVMATAFEIDLWSQWKHACMAFGVLGLERFHAVNSI
jgi:hypothetical protein